MTSDTPPCRGTQPRDGAHLGGTSGSSAPRARAAWAEACSSRPDPCALGCCPARKVPAEVEPQRGAHWAACGSPLPLRGLVATLTEKPDSSPGPPPCSRSTPERGSHGGSGPVEVGPWRTPRGAGGGLGSTGQRASSRVLEVRALPQTRCPQWNRVTRHDGNVGMWCTPARAKAKWVPQGPRAPHIQSTQSQSHGWRSIRLSRRHAQDARPDSSSEASRGLLGSTVRGPPTSGL